MVFWKGGYKERLSWDLFLWDPECVSVPLAKKAKSLCPCSDAWIWEVLWNFSVQLGQFRRDSVSLLKSFGILYVWCGVVWRGSTRISVFYSVSQRERQPCRGVCASPRWWENRSPFDSSTDCWRELWGAPAKGKAAGSSVMVIYQLQLQKWQDRINSKEGTFK